MSDVSARTDSSDLTSDLIYLRKGAGFTATRIVNAGTVRAALGGTDEPFDGLKRRFESAINSLRDPEPGLLLAAYGIGPDYDGMASLDERRRRYGAAVGRGVETIAARENAALEHLRVQLLTGWHTQSPLPVRLPEMHNGIMQESVTVSTLVVDKMWHGTEEHYRFIALFDEADYIAISSSYPGRPEPQPPFVVKTRRVGRSFSHQFWHRPGPMRRGHTYDLKFSLQPDADYGEREAIVEESRAFHERTLTAAIAVTFDGAKPSTVWTYDRLSYFERPGQPGLHQMVVPADNSPVVFRLNDLYGGLFSGLAWQW